MKRLASLLFVIGACGGGGTSSGTPDGSPDPDPDAAPPVDSPPTAFAITSPAFVQDGAIPEVITCNGDDTSPQLDWTGAPAGTMSFAIVFTDMNNTLIHSVIYDIPANLTGIPADVEKAFAPTDVAGAHQTRDFRGAFGYAGPCPNEPHVYEFALYALDVATLPGATMSTSRAQAKTLIEEHDLARTALSGTYTP